MDLRPQTRQKKIDVYIYIYKKRGGGGGGQHPENRDEPLIQAPGGIDDEEGEWASAGSWE